MRRPSFFRSSRDTSIPSSGQTWRAILTKQMRKELALAKDVLGPLPQGIATHAIFKDEFDRWILVQTRALPPNAPKGAKLPPIVVTYELRDDGLYVFPHNIPPSKYVPEQASKVTNKREIAYICAGIERYAKAVEPLYTDTK